MRTWRLSVDHSLFATARTEFVIRARQSSPGGEQYSKQRMMLGGRQRETGRGNRDE